MLHHASLDRIDISPGHDGVDQPVAPVIGEVVVREAEAPKVVDVVRQIEVPDDVPTGDAPCPSRMSLKDNGLLREQPTLRP